MIAPTERRVLLVDDEPNVLEALARHLRRAFQVTLACGSRQALEIIEAQGPFPVVVSDHMMPEMTGVQLLAAIRERSNDTITLMLTGNADLSVAAEAVNRGLLFRFLTKPCDTTLLQRALDDAFEHHRLRSAERDLLEKTLSGSIQVLADVLSLQSPAAFGRALRVKEYVMKVADALAITDRWRVEAAALLSQLGCMALPQELVDKVAAGLPLKPDEATLVRKLPYVARDLLAHVPRLDEVAHTIVAAAELQQSKTIPHAEVRILAAALCFDEIVNVFGGTRAKAIVALRTRRAEFGQDVVEALESVAVATPQTELIDADVRHLRLGMVLDQDLTLTSGIKILSAGHQITASVLQRVHAYVELKQVSGTVRVRVHCNVLALSNGGVR